MNVFVKFLEWNFSRFKKLNIKYVEILDSFLKNKFDQNYGKLLKNWFQILTQTTRIISLIQNIFVLKSGAEIKPW